MVAPMAKYTGEEFARRGQEIYDRKVKPGLRPEDDGKFVAIDIESGDYEIDRDDFQATERLFTRRTDAPIWLMRGSANRVSVWSVSADGGIPMIAGRVNSRYEIVFQISIQDAGGNEHEVEAVLDTGFNGSLTLPPAMISRLGLPWRSRTAATLADGTTSWLHAHAAIVIWDSAPKSIMVDGLDSIPLLGMALLVGFDLQARIVDGGQARITVIPISGPS